MINNKKILAVIPARGGSKRLPRKNILPFNGKPLLAWTIAAANRSKYLDKIIFSSEDDEIIEVARKYKVEIPYKRPDELAADHVTASEVVLHALSEFPNYDFVVLLQTTSPLRTAQDIDNAIERCVLSGAASCVSVINLNDHPRCIYNINKMGRLLKPQLNQEEESIVRLNGAVYVSEVGRFNERKNFVDEETIAYLMPPSRSIDIDTAFDFSVAEKLAEMNGLN
ncbi:cytidylyltransferase domain-containing protein [Candidiatus Paracoxiella cheracis]|uniref:acylneuraminate cytidylyltransferase family protein n=1 Tax=Candidiatus Paracoxiella cheracis TaxID=3405120 RepID=UPI003BF5A931